MHRMLALSGLFAAIGCTSSPKHIPPKTPAPKYTAPAAKPVNTTSQTTPSRSPIVNGAEAKDPPPPVVLPVSPGATPATISTPTMPSTSAPVQPVNATGVLPPAPPELPQMPTPPTSGGLMAPPSLN